MSFLEWSKNNTVETSKGVLIPLLPQHWLPVTRWGPAPRPASKWSVVRVAFGQCQEKLLPWQIIIFYWVNYWSAPGCHDRTPTLWKATENDYEKILQGSTGVFPWPDFSCRLFLKKKKKNLFPNQPMHVDFSPQVKKQSCFYIWNFLYFSCWRICWNTYCRNDGCGYYYACSGERFRCLIYWSLID